MASVLSHEVKTCRYSNISVINAVIRWSFSKSRGPLKNTPATSAAAPMCRNCSRAFQSGAANQRASPVRRARAAHARPIYAGAAPARPVWESEGRQFIERFVRASHLFNFCKLAGFFCRFNIENGAGLHEAWRLDYSKAFPASFNVFEESF